MNEQLNEIVKEASSAFLYFVPSLKDEIDHRIPCGTPPEERRLLRQEKGWAELCFSAHRVGVDPVEFAKQIVMLRELERRQTQT
ncbi:hypothetical protein [Pseudomonas nicosulfuronedens]